MLTDQPKTVTTGQKRHICVCICTYQRPRLLQRLLLALAAQETGGLFTYSIVIADNDQSRSAELVVSEFVAAFSVPVVYCLEPQRSIALARNRAVENAIGDYIAFVDDDEFPEEDWLQTLFTACDKYGVDGVLGPVKPSFEHGVPRWIVKGRFYDRPCYHTGLVLTYRQTRTGNVLIKESVLRSSNPPFRPEFRAGEDVDFFRRAIGQGRVFIWCNEAVVHEAVPPSRWKRMYLLRKALLRGACAALRPTVGVRDVAKSIIAVPIYGLALPFAALLGQHRFMGLLVRLCDHLGKLLALVGINPIAEPYIAG
jgi:glycosyltransferase involved in cell wall biosynthesis